MKKLTVALLALLLFCYTSAAIAQVDFKQAKSTGGKFRIVNTTTSETAEVQSLSGAFDLLNIGLKIRSTIKIDSFTVIVDTLRIWVGAQQYNAFLPGAAPGGGATTFLGLTDTPASYVGQGGNFVKVNVGATALEFVASSVTPHAILSATHNDAATSTVVRGDIITGQTATPQWNRLALGASGTILRSNGTDLAYTTATWPATTTINQLLFSSATNTVGGLATANNGVLITSAGGVPSISSTIPNATQDNITRLGTIASIGAPLGVTFGGSGANLSATGGANQFVRQSSSGAAFTVSALADADVPDHTGEVTGGTSLTIDRTTAFNWTGAHTWARSGLAGSFQNSTDNASVNVIDFIGSNRVTPTDNDELFIRFLHESSNNANEEYNRLVSKALDITNTTKDSRLEYHVMVANTLTRILNIEGAGIDIVGNIIVSGLVDGKDIATNAAMLNEAEVIASDWDNTANPWVDNEVSNTLTSSIFIGSGSTTNAIDLATAEVAGVLADANIPDHTGDVTGGTALTIANNAVTNAKAADMVVNALKMRVTAGTGDPEDIINTGLTTVSGVSGDFVIIWDADDSFNLKKVDASDFLGGSVAWEGIADAGAAGEILFADFNQDMTWNTPATATATDAFRFRWTHDATTDGLTQRLMTLERSAAGAGTHPLENLLYIVNADDQLVDTGIEIIGTSTGAITNALLLSDAEIVNWASIGTNDLVTAGGTITSVELDRLTGLAGIIATDVTAITNIDGNSLTITAGTLDVDAASVTIVGAVELATAAETTTGTDATRAVTPDGFAGSTPGTRVVEWMVSIDWDTNTATGDNAATFVVPNELGGMDLVDIEGFVKTAGTTGTLNVTLVNVTQASAEMLSTALTIDSAEKTTATAATPAVIDTANDDVAALDELQANIDGVHTTPAQGFVLILSFRTP